MSSVHVFLLCLSSLLTRPAAGPPAEGPAECRGHGSAGGPGSSPSAAAAEQRPAAAHLPAG